MSNDSLLLPGPYEESNDAPGATDSAPGSGKANGTHRKTASSFEVPTEEKIMEMLAALPRLLLLGVLSVPRANAIRGICDSMLRYSASRRSSGTAGISDTETLATFLDKDPSLAKLFEPFLTAEQIDAILRRP